MENFISHHSHDNSHKSYAPYNSKIAHSLSQKPFHYYNNAINANHIGNPAHKEWEHAHLIKPDMNIIRHYRLQRMREQLNLRDAAAILLMDPLNIRYATDTTNMQLWCIHNPVRYALILNNGPLILFDYHNCDHIHAGLDLIDEVRPAISWFYFEVGNLERDRACDFAKEIADLIKQYGGGNKNLLIDKIDPDGYNALLKLGITITASQEFSEEARKIKHPEEINAIKCSINTSEHGIAEMWRQLKPGITENQLWSYLHQTNIARGGEWIETRLLAAGARTNPWFHESSDNIINAGDMVGFDTDLIGPYGYCTDISRSWVCPDKKPTDEQLRLHDFARDFVYNNTELLEPGLSFHEFATKSRHMPDNMYPNRYSVLLHGVGLCDEYPAIRCYPDQIESGYDGIFEAGMVVCVEVYAGPLGAKEGVKFETQHLITDTGSIRLDNFSDEIIPE